MSQVRPYILILPVVLILGRATSLDADGAFHALPTSFSLLRVGA